MIDRSRKEARTGVLLVDQGISFGGAIIVLSTIAHYCRDRYRPHLVTAMPASSRDRFDAGGATVHHCTPGYTYADHWRATSRARRLRFKPLRKLAIYGHSLIGGLKNLAYALRIRRLILEHDIALVHANNSIFVVIAAFLARRPCIWHFHLVPGEPRPLLHRLFEPAIRRYLSISHFVTDAAISHGYPAEKFRTLHNPVSWHFCRGDEEIAQARNRTRTELGVAEEECVIAIFGRVIEWKGQKELLQAFALVDADTPTRLVIVGDASEGFGSTYQRDLPELADALGVGDRVEFTGFVPDPWRFYCAADIVVHASTEPEPFGLMVIEAMATKRPVIVSALGAPRELVTDGTEGFVVDPRDTHKLAAQLQRLADAPELRRSMGEAGYERVQRSHLPGRYTEDVLSMYAEILNRVTRSPQNAIRPD